MQPYHTEVGAGTFNPATLAARARPRAWRTAYVEPSIRPTDGRYGENPYRLQHYFQYQVLLKPSPDDVQELYLEIARGARHRSARARHPLRRGQLGGPDARAPGAPAGRSGSTAWRSRSSPTSSRPAASTSTRSPSRSPTASSASRCTCRAWTRCSTSSGRRASRYGDVYRENERQWSTYNFEVADVDMLRAPLRGVRGRVPPLPRRELPMPAYDYVLKCSHAFNLLDARGAISVTERVGYIQRVRNLARAVAQRVRRAAPAGARRPRVSGRPCWSSSAARSCPRAPAPRAHARRGAIVERLAASASARARRESRALRRAATHRRARRRRARSSSRPRRRRAPRPARARRVRRRTAAPTAAARASRASTASTADGARAARRLRLGIGRRAHERPPARSSHEVVDALVAGLQFPKNMRWGTRARCASRAPSAGWCVLHGDAPCWSSSAAWPGGRTTGHRILSRGHRFVGGAGRAGERR